MNGYQVQRRHNHRWITMGVGTLEVAARTARELSETCPELIQIISPAGFKVARYSNGEQWIEATA